MGQTYVYNLGSYEADPSKDISLEVGLFFDGTLNNKTNTELRLKYLNELEDGKEVKDYIVSPNDTPKVAAEKRRKSQYLILPTDDEATVRAKEKLISEKRERWDKRYKKGDKIEYEQYYEADKRSWLDKLGTDNSYMNDFTNVARMWKCCTEDYGIYIEGIGTLDKQKDDDIGFQFGAGIAGIRAKVRKGCELLADKIKKKIKKKIGSRSIKEIQNINVTIDVFGFSRGAAAARNFLYEINGDKSNRPKDRKITKNREVVKTNFNPYDINDFTALQKIEADVYRDKDGFQVNPAYLDNGKMPNMGYLGYYLLKKNGFTIEQLNKVKLTIRFVGLYDTVSSYEKGVSTLSWKAVKHTYKNHLFANDVKELQLNNLGRPKKVVHFTAMDEHRENFALTKIPEKVNFIEKAFPGVHSDIGGGYETGIEVVDEVETSNNRNLEKERQNLINEYWYKENQLGIKNEGLYKKLIGTRFLKKEYSYIPLHFMEEFFADFLMSNKSSIISKTSKTEYSIDDNKTLVFSRKHLTKYIRGNRKEKWEFIPDDILSLRSESQNDIQKPQEIKKDNLYIYPKHPIPSNLKNIKEDIKYINIEELEITKPQAILRKLRNQYFHWSANRDWAGMDPRRRIKRVRQIFTK